MAESADFKEEAIEDRSQMTDVEEGKLRTLFAQMGTRPKAASKEDLQQWMIDYLASVNPPPRVSLATHDSNYQQVFNVTASRKPWLARFSSDYGSEGYDLR